MSPAPGRGGIAKQGFDLLAGSLLFQLLLPLPGALVRWSVGSPVLFRQIRPGMGTHPFELRKFRTMRDARGPDGELLPDADRLAPLGTFLRASSLAELPELVNVLRGEMSLVGPRPLLTEYLPLYSAEQARRHEVRPGITGWAQVNGRNALDRPARLALDVWYVDHRSFWLDLRILWLTFWKVVRREGISQPGQATMERFRGNA